MRTALTAAALLTPFEQIAEPVIVIVDGKIAQLGSRDSIALPSDCDVTDFGLNVLAPGYIDLHIHGAAGHDVMHADAAELAAVAALIAEHGVTSYCPTTVTAPLDATLRALERLADAVAAKTNEAKPSAARARAVGIHLEGPFISAAKRGVHPEKDLQAPSVALFDRMWQAARGHVRVMTIAPELPNAAELIVEATKRKVVVSLGHSDADATATNAGIAAGARHATHTFNAMRALDHRAPGILGTVLADDRLTADIIADGVHVDPAVVELFLRAKGEERAVLVTDGLSATGMGDGKYQLGEMQVEVAGPRCTRNGTLAGSVLTMDRAVRNIMDFAGWDLRAAARLGSANPARVLGLNGKGTLAPGADADIVVLSSCGEVVTTFVGGRSQ